MTTPKYITAHYKSAILERDFNNSAIMGSTNMDYSQDLFDQLSKDSSKVIECHNFPYIRITDDTILSMSPITKLI